MARPLRKLYPVERIARRRHRTWMVSMTLATLAMGVWGVTVVLMKVAPQAAPGLGTAFLISLLFAVPGLILACLTVRARKAWLMFAGVPILANGMLVVLPWIVMRLREG